MSTMNLTLIGMYNYDSTLFDNLNLPPEIDKNLFINALLLRAGEFETLYPNVDFMKHMIGVWGDKWNRTFKEWIRGTQATWNPIENYDRYEDIEDHDDTKHHVTTGLTSTSTGTMVREGQTSAYDSSGYQPSDKETQSYDHFGTSDNGSNNGTNDRTYTRDAHIHGNIGVTQASDMLKSFYEISKWNLFENMADLFVSEFLLPVY